MPPATELLDDRDHAKNDDERQDAVELHVPSQDREDAVPRRAGWRRRSVFPKPWCIDAGVRIAAARTQRRQRPPATPVVVLDLLEGTRREAHRQVIHGGDGDRTVAWLPHAIDAIDVAADIDTGRWGRRICLRFNEALHSLRSRRGFKEPGTEKHEHLVVAGLRAAAGHLAVLHRQRHLAGQRRLVAGREVGWW